MALVEEKNSAPQGQASPPADQAAGRDTRYDPVILRTAIASFDWRNDTTTNALTINRPAVQRGIIAFFQPFPGDPDLCSFREGGLSPFEATLFQMRAMIRAPFERGVYLVVATTEIIVPRGVQLAQVISRGLFSMTADKVDVVRDIPVDMIGGAGGLNVQGSPIAGSALNRGTKWEDGFPLPEPLELNTGKPHLEANIKLAQYDLAYLGVGPAGLGVGAPWAPDRYIDAAGAVQVAGAAPSVLPTVLSLEFFGQRGLNIKAGQMPSAPGFPCYYPPQG